MAESGMQPEQDPQLLGDAAPNTITASVSWPSTGGVTITLPQVDNSDPSSATWDSGSTTSGANRTYTSSTTNTGNNSLSAVYTAGTYSNSAIPHGTTRVTLTKE